MKRTTSLVVVLMMVGGCVAESGPGAPPPAVTESATTLEVADVANQVIRARYDDGELILDLHSRVEAGEVLSEIRLGSGELLTTLHLPNDRVVDEATFAGVQHSIDETRERLMGAYPDGVPQRFFNGIAQLGQDLWVQTEAFQDSALRYSTTWHNTVLRGTLSDVPFDTSTEVCGEVYEDPNVPWHTHADHDAKAELDGLDLTSPPTLEAGVDGPTDAPMEQAFLVPWKCGSTNCHGCCGGGFEPGDWCMWDAACYAHDKMCGDCDPGWFCFSGCVPDK